MPRFFIRGEQVLDGKIRIVGDDARHISFSLRMAVGESVTVCDMQGVEYDCTISSFDGGDVVLDVLNSCQSENEPRVNITLYQALPKGDKLDSVIQKAVECGVSKIVPFESERCIVRIKSDAEDKKRVRRCRISEEASKQCGRSIIPDVTLPVTFEKMIEGASKSDLCIFCYEGEGTEPLGKILSGLSLDKKDRSYEVAVVVGSEGGFSISEAQRARESGFLLAGLGKRILRTETAPIFVLSNLVCFSELV